MKYLIEWKFKNDDYSHFLRSDGYGSGKTVVEGLKKLDNIDFAVLWELKEAA